ncbi:MAG: CYTH and CHAD domain-containing protein [Ornithinimicrobium sp.]
MGVHDEIEITFHADLDLDLASELKRLVQDVPGMQLLADPEHFTLEATYFDTRDLRLAGASLTLRRRVGGDDQGWHLKIPAGDDTRAETHLPLSRARKTVPAGLRRMVWTRSLGAPLAAVAQIETARTAYLLADSGGHPLLEIADDTVTASRLRGDAAHDEPQRWREVEVEVKEGSAEMMAQVAGALRRSGLVDASGASRSKVIRALDIQPPPAPTPPSAQSLTGHVVMAYLTEQVEQLRALDPQVRLDRPGSIHKMRVATRRLRSTLQTFRSAFDPAVTEPLRVELKWLAKHLGDVRDADVQRTRLMSAEREGMEREADFDAVKHAARHLQDTYAHRHAALLADLDSDRYRDLVAALVAVVDQPPLTKRADRPARDVLPKAMRRSYRTVRRAVSRVEDCPAQTRGEALHRARKSAKRARYAAEALTPVFGEPAARFAEEMEELQDVLGEHQDSVVMRGLLKAWTTSEPNARRAFAYGRRDAQEQQCAQAAQEAFTRRWSSLHHPRHKHRLRWMRSPTEPEQ